MTRLAAEVLPPMLPATWVPCPNGSPVTFGSVGTKFARATILPLSAVCSAMPESMTATPMPWPL